MQSIGPRESQPSSFGGFREKSAVNNKIADVLESFDPGLAEAFWKKESSKNSEILLILLSSMDLYLAKAFVKDNPESEFDFTQDLGDSEHSLLNAALSVCRENNDWELLEALIAANPIVDLTQPTMFGPSILDVLIHENQVRIVHQVLDAFKTRGTAQDLSAANKIFRGIQAFIKDQELEKKNFRGENKADKNLWNTYLFLINDFYSKPFTTKNLVAPDFLKGAEGVSETAQSVFLPEELWSQISYDTVAEDNPVLGQLPRELFQQRISPESTAPFIKKLQGLSTLCFAAMKEEGLVLDNNQKKTCFKLISDAFNNHHAQFSPEIKDRIVEEMREVKHFSEREISEAIEKAFDRL